MGVNLQTWHARSKRTSGAKLRRIYKMDISSVLYVACLFLVVFALFNGLSQDIKTIKKSALKALAIVAFALIVVAFY